MTYLGGARNEQASMSVLGGDWPAKTSSRPILGATGPTERDTGRILRPGPGYRKGRVYCGLDWIGNQHGFIRRRGGFDSRARD